ncbi:ARM repeat-containing protein [Gonapodya prolifera JEL478]|uniref:ARM repeat-containing protein n=1 Tax=Gonapodya prolifera (strain JEL478) TaxID=1344416 RepID=A0A139A0G9_GONPJ|nr:ARM repeat-containing protein [Gonapodya prolifera JEL478]|eukprot:KXS10035.1 ARM repeat-containing protein [Gonapodya prolifera JEL478]
MKETTPASMSSTQDGTAALVGALAVAKDQTSRALDVSDAAGVAASASQLGQVLRQVRNAAVGSARRKDALVKAGLETLLTSTLHLLPRLPNPTSTDPCVTALSVVSSLAGHASTYPFPDWTLDESTLLPPVFALLGHEDTRVVDAALRAAKALLTCSTNDRPTNDAAAGPPAAPAHIALPPAIASVLVNLLATPSALSPVPTRLTALAARLVADLARASILDSHTAAHAASLLAACVKGSLGAKVGSPGDREAAAALEALAALLEGHHARDVAEELLRGKGGKAALGGPDEIVDMVAGKVREGGKETKVWACEVFTLLPSYSTVSDHLSRRVLPALLKLTSENPPSIPPLQLGVGPDMESSRRVVSAPRGPHPGVTLLASALAALAAASSLSEPSRCATVASVPHILPLLIYIVAGKDKHLRDLDPRSAASVRVAACATVRSLSRSPKLLRTSLADANVAAVLSAVVDEEVGGKRGSGTGMHEDLVREAVAGMCNMVLEGKEPGKKAFLNPPNPLPHLVSLTRHANPHLRLNAIWCLKNLLFGADAEVKRSVVSGTAGSPHSGLGWDALVGLCGGMDPDADDNGALGEVSMEDWREPELAVREQAMNAMRNITVGREEDIDYLFSGLGEARLIKFLENHLRWCTRECTFGDVASSKMDMDGDEESRSDVRDGIALQVLYLVVNVAIGTERHKGALMSSNTILEAVKRFWSHPSPSHRTAACWVSINLTWVDDAGTPERLSVLRDISYPQHIERILDDADVEVRDKAQSALNAFGGEGNTTGRRWSQGGWGERERERESQGLSTQEGGGVGRTQATLGARYGSVWGRTGSGASAQPQPVVFGTLGDGGTVESGQAPGGGSAQTEQS